MSFTITCDKCGNKQTFTNESRKFGDNVSVNVFTVGYYTGDVIETIDIDCENPKCNNDISIKY